MSGYDGHQDASALRKYILARLAEEPTAFRDLERLLGEAGDHVKDIAYSLPFDVSLEDTVDPEVFIKAMAPAPDTGDCVSPGEYALHTARVIDTLGLWSCAVFVGVRAFLTEESAARLFEALSGLRLSTVFIDRALDTPIVKGEIRTVINKYLWDCSSGGVEPAGEL